MVAAYKAERIAELAAAGRRPPIRGPAARARRQGGTSGCPRASASSSPTSWR